MLQVHPELKTEIIGSSQQDSLPGPHCPGFGLCLPHNTMKKLKKLHSIRDFIALTHIFFI